MLYYVISGVVCALSISAIGIFVILHNRKRSDNFYFFLFCIFVALNVLGSILLYFIASENSAFYVMATLAILSVGAQSSLISFFNAFTKASSNLKKHLALAHFLFGVICTVFLYLNVCHGQKKEWLWHFKINPIFHVLYFIFTLFTFCFLAYGSIKAIKQWKNTLIEAQVKYFLVALSIVFIGVGIDIIQQAIVASLNINMAIPLTFNLGYITLTVFVGIIAFSIVKKRFLDIYSALHKSLAWGFAIGLFAFLFVYLKNLMDAHVTGIAANILFGLSAITLLSIFQSVLPKISHVLHRRKFQLDHTLSKYHNLVLSSNTFAQLHRNLSIVFQDTLYPIHFALFIKKESDMFENVIQDSIFKQHLPATFLSEHNINQAKHILKQSHEDTLFEDVLLLAPDPHILIQSIVPITEGNRITGIIVLSQKKSYKSYTHVDLYFLNNLSDQVSFAIQGILDAKKMMEDQYVKNQLSNKIEQLKELTHFVTHEIKTPLFIINGHAKKILTSAADEITCKTRSGLIRKECEELSKFLNNYLLAEKINAGIDNSLSITRVDLKNTLLDVVSRIEDLFHQFGMKIQSHLIGELYVHGDKDKLGIVFSNLLSNSLKYADKNTVIEINAKEESENIVLTFKDQGKGISKKVLENIFDKQSGSSDNRFYASSGLGLGICKLIIEQHYGQIHIRSTEDIGTEITLMIPKGEKSYA